MLLPGANGGHMLNMYKPLKMMRRGEEGYIRNAAF